MEHKSWKRKNNTGVPAEVIHHPGAGVEVPLLHFPLLEKTGIVKEGFTTRLGGVSEGIFSTMNLSFTRGDEEEAVRENYRRLASALDVDYDKFVFTDQTHTTNVRKVTAEDAGNGLTREREFHDTDGLITDVPGLVLSTFYADCVPLYFVDPVHCAIGLSHSGWRGTVNRMGKATIEAMRREYGSRPEELRCAIGPSICQDCYEVSGDVAVEFERAFAGHEHEILIAKENGKYSFIAVDENGNKSNTCEVEINNVEYIGELHMYITGQDGIPLEGAGYGIYYKDINGDYIALKDEEGNDLIVLTDEEGKIDYSNLKYGEYGNLKEEANRTYYLLNKVAPSGYNLSIDYVEININSESENKIVELELTPGFVLPPTGKF